MTWRASDTRSDESVAGQHTTELDGQRWVFQQAGKMVYVCFGDGPYLELPRLSKLEGFFAEPDLACAGTEHIVATPPTLYLARGTAPLGIDDVTCGTYDITWYDLEQTQLWELTDQTLDGGEEVLEPPEPVDGQTAVFLRRTSL